MSDFTTNSPVAITRPHFSLSGSQTVIKRALYEELVNLSDAWERARNLIAEAKDEAATLREQYRQEGLELGAKDAQEYAIEQVVQMQGSMNEWVKSTDAQLIELVNRCVGEVVNKIDPTLLVTQSVERGLAELASAAQIIVRVHPDTKDMEQTIVELTQRYGITGTVRLVQDGTLAVGDAIVESPVGTVDLRLANQLKLISKALKP